MNKRIIIRVDTELYNYLKDKKNASLYIRGLILTDKKKGVSQ